MDDVSGGDTAYYESYFIGFYDVVVEIIQKCDNRFFQNLFDTIKEFKLTFCNHIAVDETVRYTPHPNDPGKTLLQQEAVVTVSGVPLTHYMEELLTSKICFNSGMGRQAMEWVIEKLHLEEFDDLLTQTVRQFDDLTSKTRRGMDDLQSAIKSFDEIHNLTNDDDNDNDDDDDDDDENDEDDNDDSDDDEDEDDEVEGEGEREMCRRASLSKNKKNKNKKKIMKKDGEEGVSVMSVVCHQATTSVVCSSTP
uniref:PRELI/MSF1 domain-containing protein n=1 Tax=Vespula pensylvanica TaxID=30213 RepID=A0A834K184_VESPE|nr:hypothetical protein H0235_016190 [Vespula pensylvanica]